MIDLNGTKKYPWQSNIIGAGAGTGGGLKIDKQKLMPVLGALVAYLYGQKQGGYGGLAAGQYGQTMNSLEQQEEERKRYEAEQQRQAWLDAVQREEIERQKKEREQAAAQQKQTADFAAGKLGPMGAGIPGTEGTPAIPAYTHPLNRPEFVSRLAPEDQALAAQATGGTPTVASGTAQNKPAIAATPGTPGTPGDPMAQFWADAITKSGGAPWAVQGALAYYQSTLQKKTPMLDYETILKNAHPKNIEAQRVRSMMVTGLQPTKEDMDRVLEYEKYLTGEETKRYGVDVGARTDIAIKGMEEGGAPGATSTELVKKIDAEYTEYAKSNPKTTYDKANEAWKPNPKFLTKEQWVRKYRGDAVWAQYAQESGSFGGQYTGDVGKYILQYGGVAAALQKGIKAMPYEVAVALKDRYNKEHGTKYTLEYWMNGGSTGGKK